MKSGNLNFLELSGPLQACNGTALPYIFTRKKYYLLPLCHIFHNKSHMDFSGNQTGKLYHSYISYENFIFIQLNYYPWILPGWRMKTNGERYGRIKLFSHWRRYYSNLFQLVLFVCVSCNVMYMDGVLYIYNDPWDSSVIPCWGYLISCVQMDLGNLHLEQDSFDQVASIEFTRQM
jgi:hypothetical protein